MARLAFASEPVWKMLLRAFVFCAILAGTTAGPTGVRRVSKCVSFCKDTNNFGYEPGTTYTHDYTADISTSAIGGSNQESRVHLFAKAQISAVSKCELILTLHDVAIEESDADNPNARRNIEGSNALAAELEKLPLRFSLQGGKVEHLCAAEEEPMWALNVKRGIISTLQNTMENLAEEQTTTEVDVNGRCQTTYKPLGNSWAGSNEFQKIKDLGGCSQRHSHISAIQSIPYSSQSLMQSLPLLSGKQECNQRIRNGKIEKVQCHETHKFQPFQQADSGAQTVVSQVLVFVSESPGVSPSDDALKTWKTSLLYQTEGPTEASEEDLVNIMSILQRLEADSVPEIRAEAPEQFIYLVESLRLINARAMKDLFTRVTSPTGKKFLLDAMPLVASAPSLALMRDLLLDGMLTEKQIDAWLSSFIFIKHPTVDMLRVLKPLVDYQPRNQALLSVSAMVNSYCKTNPDCTEEAPVEDILERLFAHLGNNCEAFGVADEQSRILYALKAIGNAGRLPTEEGRKSLEILTRCFSSTANPTEVRLAALDAFRRIPCDLYDHQPIINTYSRMQEDTEVRIQAYLMAMKCVDHRLVDTVKDVLYTDAVNQVSSFVWTHLTNLQETSSPDKQAIRELLTNEFLKNKFNTDARKYSRNYEGSFYSDKWNAGASADSNVIFTPDSFLPRSGMVNLTVHLFGESVNLLELGVRVKSLEHLLEPIFGPTGYFPDQRVTQALHSLRPKRDVSNNQIDRLESIYNQAGLDEQHQPTGSIYTRVFGHEIMYKNFDIGNEGNKPSLVDESGKDWMDIRSILTAITKGDNVEYTKSTVFLDAAYTVPTGAGIPLSLAIQSAATVGVTANGKFDVDKFWDQRELEIQGLIRPSAAVQVDGVMITQLGRASDPIRAGLRLQNTLHSSTSIQGEIRAKGATLIRSSISLPQDKQEIFTAKSQLLILRASGRAHIVEQGPAGLPKNQFSTCKGSAILGLKICAEMNVPEQFTFPLPAPALISLYVEKTDTIRSYEFDYSFDRDDSATSFTLALDTPGSRVNQRLEASFQLDAFNGKLDALVRTPGSSFSVDGKYSATEKSLQLTVTAADAQVLLVNAGLHGPSTRLLPTLLVTLYNRPLIEFSGSIDLLNMGEDNGRASVEFILKHLTENPIQVRGDISRSGEKFDSRVGIDSYVLTGNIRSQLRLKPGHLTTKAVAEYSWQRAETKTIDVNAKFQRSKNGVLQKFNALVSLVVPEAPEFNFDASLETQRSPGYCENNAKLTLGKSTWEGRTLYNNQMSRESQEYAVAASLKSLRHAVDYNAEFTHQWNQTQMVTKISGQTDRDNVFLAEVNYFDETDKLVHKTLTAKTSWPNKEYTLRAILNESQPGEYDGELTIIPNEVPEMKATVTYKDASKEVRLVHSFKLRARGFLPVQVAAGLDFSARDKQAHLGAQLDVEGSESYSGRWTTSLDYSVIKKNTHKLGGKLTLNDRKYTGELSYRQTKSGDRIVTLDAQGSRHLAVEAKLNGDLFGPWAATITAYPDKDAFPQEKFVLATLIDSSSISLRVDNFGQRILGSARYGDSRAQLELSIDDQAYKFDAVVPYFSLDSASVTIRISTPLTNYQDILFTLNHVCSGHGLDSKISTSIDGFEVTAVVVGAQEDGDMRLLGALDVTDMKSLKGNLRVTRRPLEKRFEVTVSRGEDDGSFKVELVHLDGGFSGILNFNVLSSLPEVHVELLHQVTDQINSNLKVEWTAPSGSSRQQISAQLSGVVEPLNVRFILQSPWEHLEVLQGGVILVNNRNDRELSITLDGNLDYMPMTLGLACKGNRADFRYEITQTWTQAGIPNKLQLLSEGHYASLSDTVVKTMLVLPEDTFELNWTSEFGDEGQKFQLDVGKNRMHVLSGITWNVEPTVKKIKATVWCEPQDKPRFTITFENARQLEDFKLLLLVTRGQEALVKSMTNLKTTGAQWWEFLTDLDSIYESVPKVKISSQHSARTDGNIRHKSLLIFGGKAIRNGGQGVYEIPQTATAEFNLREGRHFDGQLAFNDENVKLQGEMKRSDERQEIEAEITSTRFRPISAQTELRKLANGYEALLTAAANGNNLFTVTAGAQETVDRVSANMDLECSFGHHVIVNAALDKRNNQVGITLKEDRANLVDLHLVAAARPQDGNIRFELQSSLFESLQEPLKLQGEYEINAVNKLNLLYSHRDQEHALEASAAFAEENKYVRLKLSGGVHNGNFYAELEGTKQAKSSLVWDEKLIYETIIEVGYRHANGLGYHDIKITTNSDHLANPVEILTTIGYAPNKVHIATITPFTGWTRLDFIGEFHLSDAEKRVKVQVEREGVRYAAEGKYISESRNRQVGLTLETPWEGYTSGNINLEYQRRQGYEGRLSASLNEHHVGASIRFSGNTVRLEAETPFELVKRVNLEATWKLGSGGDKNLSVKAQHNDETYDLSVIWDIQPSAGKANLLLSGFRQTQDISLEYSFDEDFFASAAVRSGGDNNNNKQLGVTVRLNKHMVQVEGYTPLAGYEQFKAKAFYELKATNHYKGTLEWKLNGERAEYLSAEGHHSSRDAALTTSSSLGGNEQFSIHVYYDLDEPNKRLAATFRLKDDKPFKLAIRGNGDQWLQLMRNDRGVATIDVEIDFPLQDPLELKLSAQYVRDQSEHTLAASVTQRGDTMEGKLIANFPTGDALSAQVKATATAAKFNIDSFEAEGSIRLDPRSLSTLSYKSNLNGESHEFEASAQFRGNAAELTVNSTFGPVQNGRITGVSNDDGTFQVAVILDDQQGTLEGRYHFNGLRHSEILLELRTPFEGLKSLDSSAEVRFHPGSFSTSITFQNEVFRYVSQLSGTFDKNFESYLPPSANIQLTLKSPVYRFENVVSTLGYSVDRRSSEARFTFERNTRREMMANGSWSPDGNIRLNMESNVAEYPVKFNGSIKLNPLVVVLSLNAGLDDGQVRLEANIDGMTLGEIRLDTPLRGYENFNAQWSTEGDMTLGKAQGQFNIPKLGRKSLKSSWKTDSWRSAKLEILYRQQAHEPEKRYAIQYAVSGKEGGNGKVGGSLVYTVDNEEQQLTLNVAVKRSGQGITLDGSVQTPYNVIREAALQGKLALGQEISFDLTVALNENVQLVTSVVIAVTPKASKLKLNFSAPTLGEPFSLNAAYDVTKPEKVMEIAFVQNKYQINIHTDATIPTNSNEIELHMNVDSNVPLLQISASGSMKAGYRIDGDGTRHLGVSVNSDATGKWEVVTALRPTTDFYTLVQVSSPRPDMIQSSKLEIVYTGNLRQGVSSYASFLWGDHPEVRMSFSLSPEKIITSFVSGIPGYENISVETNFESGEGYLHKRFNIQVVAMGERVNLDGHIHIPSRSSLVAVGSLKLRSTWDKIPDGSLDLDVQESGTGLITGMWGGQEVAVEAKLQGVGRAPWSKHGVTQFVVRVNAEENLRIQATHLAHSHMYSLNATLGEDYSLDSFVQTDAEKVVAATLKWAPDQVIQLFGKAGLGRFETSITTPWTSPIGANGMYTVSEREHSANGYFVYGEQRSALEATAITTPDVFDSSVKVDIPALHQKFDTRIKIRRTTDDKLRGNMDVQMADRRLSIEGELASRNLTRSGRAEHNIKVVLTLPSTTYSKISTNLIVRYSKNDLSSLNVEGTLSLPSGTSKGAFGYEVPLHSGQGVGVQVMVDSAYISSHPIEFSASKETEGASKLDARFQYEKNDLRISYDTTLSQLHMAAFANVPELFESHNPIKFELTGVGRWPAEQSLKISGSCSQYFFSVEGQADRTDSVMNARLLANIPSLLDEQHEVTLKVEKNVGGRYLVDLTGLKGGKSVELKGEATIEEGNFSTSGRLSGALGNHFLQLKAYRVERDWFMEVNGESAVLLQGRRFKANGEMKSTANGFEAEIKCRTRLATHSAKISSVLALHNGNVRLSLESPTLAPFTANSEWAVDRFSVLGKLVIDVGEERHEAEILANSRDLEAMISVRCPTLLADGFTVHGKAIVQRGAVEFLGNAQLNGAQWKLEGMTRYEDVRNMEARVEFRTPFEDWERVTFSGKSSPDEIHAEIYTPIRNFPNAMFKISGLPVLSLLERQPLSSLDNVTPAIVIGLPWVTYSLSGVVKVPRKGVQGELGITVEYGHPKRNNKRRFEASLQIPSPDDFGWHMENPVKLHVNVRMPQSFAIQWEIGGRLQWKTWAELSAMGELNGQRIEFDSEIRNESGNRRLSMTLSTPFEGYEKYVASLRLENYEQIGTGRTILVELQHPDWEKPMRMEIDYRYRFNGLADMDAEMNIAAPQFIVDFPNISLRLQSMFRGGRYTGALDGSWRDIRPSFKVVAGLSEDSIMATVEGSAGTYQGKVDISLSRLDDDGGALLRTEIVYLNEQIVLLQGSLTKSDNSLNAELSIKSPFEMLKFASAQLRISPLANGDALTIHKVLNTLDFSFGVIYNEHKLFQVQLTSRNGRRNMEIYNPFRPISMALTFERVKGQKLRVLTEICWDLNKPAQSTLAIDFGVGKTSATHTFSMRLQAGELGGVEGSIIQLLTSSKFEQAVALKRIHPLKPELSTEIGYSFCLNDVSPSSTTSKYDLTARVDTPWRSIGLEASQHRGDKETRRLVELKWDALKDVTKRIGVKIVNERISGWKSRTLKDTMTLVHSTIPDNLVVEVVRTWKNHVCHSLQLTVQPTHFPQDHVTFSISKAEVDRDEIKIALTHPASNLNVFVVGKQTANTAAVGITYMDTTGESQAAQISFASDPSATLFEVNTGKELTSLFRIERIDDGEKNVLLLRSGDVKFDLNAYSTHPFVDLTLQYDLNKQLYLTAGLPHKKEVSLKAWRSEHGMNIQDVLVTLRLNASQILSTRINWRPELFDDLYDFAADTLPDSMMTGARKGAALLRSRVSYEVQGRWNMVEPTTRQFLENFATYTYSEWSAIYGEIEATIQQFLHMYDTNRFYMKDVGNLIGAQTGNLLRGCISSVKYAYNVARESAETVTDIVLRICRFACKYATNLEQTVIAVWDGADEYLLQLWEEAVRSFTELSENVEEYYDMLLMSTEELLDRLENRILAIGWIRKVIRIYEDYASWIEELPAPLQEVMEAVTEFINSRICKPIEEFLKPYWDELQTILEEKNIAAILDTPPFPYLRHVVVRVRILGARLWDFVEAEQKIKELVAHALHAVDNLIRQNIPSVSVTFDLDKGHIEYHQPLALIYWEDFTTLPTWKDSESNAQEISQINSFYYEVLDTIRSVKPAFEMNLRDILPPFGAHAVMAGDYHYYTFDKKYFRFAGECSYVLMADLLHRNFSLIVNYESTNGDMMKKSYTLLTQRHSVDIDAANLKVTLDGRKVELPLEVGPTFIRRMPNGIEIFDTRGFQMTCNQSPSLCTVSVSGWYFGKMAGLLGTYDNEESNDLRTPDGEVVSDIANFAHSWRVGSSSDTCRMKNLARDREEPQDVDGVCSQHFDDAGSLLRPCFSRVNTTVFKEMCQYDTSRNLNKASRQDSACTAISAYVAECQKEGVDIWLPPPCIRCRLEDGTTLMSGESAMLKTDGDVKPPNSTDVVILFEEAACLTGFSLSEGVKRLEAALRVRGLNDNRYALVGFSGQGPYRTPHIRTSSGQIWAHNTLFRVSDTIEMNGDGQGDLYDAIEFASRTLKFRAGVAKTMIAITCGNEQCGSESRYPDTITLLLENDIKLHLLTPKEFTTKGNKRESANTKVFGIDSDGAYTLEHMRDPSLDADSSLKRQLNLPKDLCTPLAIESNGTRFVFPKTYRKSLDVWAHRVAKTAVPSECQQCECIPDKSGSPHVVCNQCISPGLKEVLLEWQKYNSSDDTFPIELLQLDEV